MFYGPIKGMTVKIKEQKTGKCSQIIKKTNRNESYAQERIKKETF